MYEPRLPAGLEEEMNPSLNSNYYVLLRQAGAEAIFRATLILLINREDRVEPEDRTPTYQFDNGVVIHGTGIQFFRQPPTPVRNWIQGLLDALGQS
jgi:hypothetical protein